MVKSDIHLLYEDLNKLLNDICNFLSDEIKCGTVSNNSRLLADELIKRSKKQLQCIAVIAPEHTDDEYVVMNNSELPNSDENLSENAYNDPDSFQPEIETDDVNCPYIDKPVNDVPHPEKMGFLERKEKFFFIGHQKKIYACICDRWMLIYYTHKEQKPCDVLDLREYSVKSADDQRKPSDKVFELVSSKTSKLWQFTATTAKDTDQWVAAINRQSTNISYFIQEPEQEIYERIENDDQPKSIDEPPRKLPSPPRYRINNSITKRPVPPPPSTDKILEHLTGDDDDDDDIYDVIISNKPALTNTGTNNNPTTRESKVIEDDDSDGIYEVLKPDSPANSTPQPPSRSRSDDTSLSREYSESFSEDEDVAYDQLAAPTEIAIVAPPPTKIIEEPEQETYDEIQPPAAIAEKVTAPAETSSASDDEQLIYDVIQTKPQEVDIKKDVVKSDDEESNFQFGRNSFLHAPIKPKTFPKPPKKK